MNKKFAIITGGSKGIGAACISNYQNNGYEVISISRMANTQAHHNLLFDLNNKIENAFIDSIAKIIPFGSQISLIHNAFPYWTDNSTNFNDSAFDKAIQFTLKNSIRLNNFVLEKSGENSSIVFVGSTLSTKAAANCLSYVILKHAQLGLMRSLAIEMGDKKIHTCCVCPGFTDTEMLKSHTDKKNLDSLINSIVLKKRLISPAEIADFIYHCSISPISNGEVYHVNLGQI